MEDSDRLGRTGVWIQTLLRPGSQGMAAWRVLLGGLVQVRRATLVSRGVREGARCLCDGLHRGVIRLITFLPLSSWQTPMIHHRQNTNTSLRHRPKRTKRTALARWQFLQRTSSAVSEKAAMATATRCP